MASAALARGRGGAAPELTPGRLRLLSVAAILAIWELVAQARLVDPFFSSSPSRILRSFVGFAADPGWYLHLAVSLGEFAAGLASAIAIGVPLGLTMYLRPGLGRTLDPFMMAMNSTPRAALVPLVVLWFGIGLPGKAVIVFLGAIFPVVVMTLTGARATDPVLLKMARSLVATERDIFVKVVLPGALPYALEGVRQGVGRALIGMVVAEMYVSQAGLGNLIMNAAASLNTDALIALAFLISLLGLGLALSIDRTERLLCPWNARRRGR